MAARYEDTPLNQLLIGLYYDSLFALLGCIKLIHCPDSQYIRPVSCEFLEEAHSVGRTRTVLLAPLLLF